MIALALALVVVVVLLVRRRRRKGELAGRNSARPVYSVEPPSRRIGNRKHEAL